MAARRASYALARRTRRLKYKSIGDFHMDEEKFNISMRKFLKQVGVTSQHEIEAMVRERGLTSGKIKVRMVLTSENTSLNHVVEGEIDLG